MLNIDTLFQTEKCETQLTFESETARLSEHAAGLEREQQRNPDCVPESECQKVDPVPDRNADL